MPDWEKKLDAMARETLRENITAVLGAPTWALVLFRKLFQKARISSSNVLDIWPNLELIGHGAVSFLPYEEQFRQLVPNPRVRYFESYNASEGYFAIQNENDDKGMLLLADHGIFYEFIRPEDFLKPDAKALTLDEVVPGENYAMVISTVGGLWRYMLGDTVKFTSLYPHKLKITGRTKHFINAFGEELMVENADAGIAWACEQTGAIVADYTAGPYYPEGREKGLHEWVIEFTVHPPDIEQFAELLDQRLREVNGDYDAKRTRDVALARLQIHPAPQGTFHTWLYRRGKLGGQNKVPRLANNREYLDSLMPILAELSHTA
jgi:hypothetical protein